MIGIVGILHLNYGKYGTARCIPIVHMVYQCALSCCWVLHKLLETEMAKLQSFADAKCRH